MKTIQYFIISLIAVYGGFTQQTHATSAYFYFKDAAHETPVEFSITPSRIESPAINPQTYQPMTTYRTDTAAVTQTKLAPGDTTNKYVYATQAIGGIGVNAAQPIVIKGRDGKVFFEGAQGVFGANIPTGQIWEFIIEKSNIAPQYLL